jgi:hypothetical protein
VNVAAADARNLPDALAFVAANGVGVAFLSRLGVVVVPRQTPNHGACVTFIALCGFSEAAAASER